MPVTNDTVHDRIERVRLELTPAQLAAALAVVGLVGVALLFLQGPAFHDSLHDFRHSIGIICH